MICIFKKESFEVDFVASFDDADELILTHIYAAREVYDGVTDPDRLAEEIKARGIDAKYIDKFEDIEAYIKETAQPGDLIFTMGAGDVTQISDNLFK